MAQVINILQNRFLLEEFDNSPDAQTQTEVIEIYSEWKDWKALSDNLKYSPAMRVVGGDPISPTQNLGSTFFLINNWKLKPAEYSHEWEIVGNLFADPFTNKVIQATDGTYTVLALLARSNLVDSSIARLDLAQLQETVYIDTVNGDDSNSGTPTAPVQTEAAALAIAQAENLRAYSIIGSLTLANNYEAWRFVGTVSQDSATINLGNQSVDKCDFEGVEITGTGSGQIFARTVRLSSVVGIYGTIEYSGISGLTAPAGNSKTTLYKCYSEEPGLGFAILDLAALSEADFLLRGFSGSVEIRNVDVADQDVSLDFESGRAILASSCTDGTIVVRAANEIADNSAGSTVVIHERGEFTEADRTVLNEGLTEDDYIELKNALD